MPNGSYDKHTSMLIRSFIRADEAATVSTFRKNVLSFYEVRLIIVVIKTLVLKVVTRESINGSLQAQPSIHPSHRIHKSWLL